MLSLMYSIITVHVISKDIVVFGPKNVLILEGKIAVVSRFRTMYNNSTIGKVWNFETGFLARHFAGVNDTHKSPEH